MSIIILTVQEGKLFSNISQHLDMLQIKQMIFKNG